MDRDQILEKLKLFALVYVKHAVLKDNMKRELFLLLPELLVVSGEGCTVKDLVQELRGIYVSAILDVCGSELQITYDEGSCEETKAAWLRVFNTPGLNR